MANTTSTNPTLTRDQVEAILVLPLTQASTYMSAGFPVFVSNGEPIKVPSLQSMGTAGYVAEGAQIPQVSASTNEIELLASTVHAVKIITRVSRELMRQSVVNIENTFSTKMVSDVSRILDEALWNGAGTGGAPLGLAKFTGITSAGTAGGTVTPNLLYEMQELALDENIDFPQARWAMSPKNLTRIRKLADSTGQKFLAPSLAAGAPATLLGNAYTVTNHLPDDLILFFDPAQVAIGMDDRASISLLDQTYADYDEIGIRVTARYDTKALNPKAIVKLSGLTA